MNKKHSQVFLKIGLHNRKNYGEMKTRKVSYGEVPG